MAKTLTRLLLILFALLPLVLACGQGTETGNPGQDAPQQPQPNNYANEDFDVALEYDSDWSFDEQEAPPAEAQTPTGDTEDGEPTDQPAPSVEGGINTSSAPSTEFTDGTTTVTFFFVTLSEEPESLISYLGGVFPSRSFVFFSNPFTFGFSYDNPEAGENGGDRQEYYFLDGITLLYIVTDLFDINDGFENFETIIDSIRFF